MNNRFNDHASQESAQVLLDFSVNLEHFCCLYFLVKFIILWCSYEILLLLFFFNCVLLFLILYFCESRSIVNVGEKLKVNINIGTIQLIYVSHWRHWTFKAS